MKILGIKDKNLAMNLLKLSRIVLTICRSYVSTTTAGCIALTLITTGSNYSLTNLLVFKISCTIFWGIWCYNACKSFYYFPEYFFIVCYHLKLHFSSIEKRHKYFIKSSKRYSMTSKISMIRLMLRDHNNLCKQIYVYNQYWKKYLTIFYLLIVFLVCFITYVVFISPIKWFVRIEYCRVI
jgi:hypothetical protein